MTKIPKPKKLELQGNFFQVENAALELNGNEFKAYCVLRAFSYGKDIIDISSNELAKRGKMNEKTFRTAIKKLEEKGYIKVYKKPVDNIKDQNVYQLLPLKTSTVKTTVEQTEIEDIPTVKLTERPTVKTTLGNDDPTVKTTLGPTVKLTVNNNKQEIKKDINNKREIKEKKEPSSLTTQTRINEILTGTTEQAPTLEEFIYYYTLEHEKAFNRKPPQATPEEIEDAFYVLRFKYDLEREEVFTVLPSLFETFKQTSSLGCISFKMLVSQRGTFITLFKKALKRMGKDRGEVIEFKQDPYKERQRQRVEKWGINSKPVRKEIVPDWLEIPKPEPIRVGQDVF